MRQQDNSVNFCFSENIFIHSKYFDFDFLFGG